MQQSVLIFSLAALISWLTVPAAVGPSPYELLGIEPFGKILYVGNSSAPERSGIDVNEGAVVVLRPDGWIGTMINLTAEHSVQELEQYFERILVVD